MSHSKQPQAALLVSPDLLFAGKIQAAAEPLGLQVLQEETEERIARALAENEVCVVFLDLNVTKPAIAEIMERLPSEPRPLVVAFGPHVNTVRLAEARAAGCDRVLPRSRFVQELPELLKLARDSA